ncbi:hypothetical protein QUF75_06570 [Desulfococcaceae bacterium HSG7]|nr:hypothetical protein [Desulfococcaceae bacterium HSG7]
MWLAALLLSFSILMTIAFVKWRFDRRKINQGEELSIFLLTTCMLFFLSSSFFSYSGALTVLHCAIPIVTAITIFILNYKYIRVKSYYVKYLIIIIIFLPFYYMTAWADWQFTYFDVSPDRAKATIEKGFGQGIKTNQIYLKLYQWIQSKSEAYTQKNDFMLSYVNSPMNYMIAKRRPALESSITCFGTRPPNSYGTSIEKMITIGRHPKIAFVFEAYPAFYPISLKGDRLFWLNKQFNFSNKDPISKYILDNMELLEEYNYSQDRMVRCFIANSHLLKAESLGKK